MTVLLCPDDCDRSFEVSKEDPDAAIAEIHAHLMFNPHYRNAKTALELLAEVEGAASHSDLLAIGITARQVDHWTRRGWILPWNSSPGSGHNRIWPEREANIARLMLRLIEAGWNTEAAAPLARAVIEGHVDEPGTVRIGPGLTLKIDAALIGEGS